MNPNDPRYNQGGSGNGQGFGYGGGFYGNPGQQGGGQVPPPPPPPPPPPSGAYAPRPMQQVALPVIPERVPFGLIAMRLMVMAGKWILIIMALLLVLFFIFSMFGFATGAITGFFAATSQMLSRFFDSIAGSRIGIGRNGDGVLALGMVLIAIVGIVKLLRR